MKYTKREQEIIYEAAEIIGRVRGREHALVRLHRTQISGVMLKAGCGRVSFVKKDGALRLMYFETLWSDPSTSELGTEYMVVWDTEKEGYRKVNLETVTRLKTKEADYRIV